MGEGWGGGGGKNKRTDANKGTARGGTGKGGRKQGSLGLGSRRSLIAEETTTRHLVGMTMDETIDGVIDLDYQEQEKLL